MGGGACGLVTLPDWPCKKEGQRAPWKIEAIESRWNKEVNDFRLGVLAPIP